MRTEEGAVAKSMTTKIVSVSNRGNRDWRKSRVEIQTEV